MLSMENRIKFMRYLYKKKIEIMVEKQETLCYDLGKVKCGNERLMK